MLSSLFLRSTDIVGLVSTTSDFVIIFNSLRLFAEKKSRINDCFTWVLVSSSFSFCFLPLTLQIVPIKLLLPCKLLIFYYRCEHRWPRLNWNSRTVETSDRLHIVMYLKCLPRHLPHPVLLLRVFKQLFGTGTR